MSYYGPNENPPDQPAMTREEEDRLFIRYKRTRCPKAKEALVRRYLCWAFKLSSGFKGPRLTHEEATGAANLGLMEAFSSFDPSKGFRFSTHAYFAIRRRLIEALRLTYPVKITDHFRKNIGTYDLLDPVRIDDSPANPARPGHSTHRLRPVDPAVSESCAGDVSRRDSLAAIRKFLTTGALSHREKIVLQGIYLSDPPKSYASLMRRLKTTKLQLDRSLVSAIRKLKHHLTHGET